MGYDSDHPRSLGEVGREGVAVDTLDDMETLFAGHRRSGEVTTSMTINAPGDRPARDVRRASAGRSRGVPLRRDRRARSRPTSSRSTSRRRSGSSRPGPAMRLVQRHDRVLHARGARAGTRSRSAATTSARPGATAAQELAFTLADGIAYVRGGGRARASTSTTFAPRLSFFFDVHNDFFEEIAKFRAARRMWARDHARDGSAPRIRARGCCASTRRPRASALTAQQPLNNVVRTALQALAAVLGGTQSLHTNSIDETLALPTEEAVTIALRTQQIIAHETGVTNTVDPLGGCVLRRGADRPRWRRAAYEYFPKIDEFGGMVEAIEHGYPQREIAEAAFAFQQEIDAGRADRGRRQQLRGRRRAADPHPARRPRARAQADRAPAGGARQARRRRRRAARLRPCASTPRTRIAT